MRVDSYVMEIFTSNSLFLDIYGFCGLSQLIEAMPNGDLEAQALPLYSERETEVVLGKELKPQNKLTVKQKLTFCLEMAEGIANLHNYPGGVIVHDDIQLPQFLMTDDNQHIKFQDFNRGEILLFDEKHQEYCTYINGKGHGDMSSLLLGVVGFCSVVFVVLTPYLSLLSVEVTRRVQGRSS